MLCCWLLDAQSHTPYCTCVVDGIFCVPINLCLYTCASSTIKSVVVVVPVLLQVDDLITAMVYAVAREDTAKMIAQHTVDETLLGNYDGKFLKICLLYTSPSPRDRG